MIFTKSPDKVSQLTSRVEQQNGIGWVYVHSCAGIGPDGRNAMVDVFSNGEADFDLRRSVYVLNGKVLTPF